MVKRPLFRLTGIEWKLAFRNLPLLLAFLGAGFFGAEWWALIAVGCVFFILYFLLPSPERRMFRVSFFILGIAAPLNFSNTDSGLGRAFIVLIALSAVFIVSLTSYHLSRQYLTAATFVNTATLFSVCLLTLRYPENLGIGAALFFTALTLLFLEYMKASGVLWQRRRAAAAAALGFLGTELFFFTRFLPTGPAAGAVLLTLFLALLRDTLVAHFEGSLSSRFVLHEAVLFVAGTLLVFSLSS